jgi:hypothetical protein
MLNKVIFFLPAYNIRNEIKKEDTATASTMDDI